MKIHECIQGSAQWLRLRMGKPTASEFSRIVTPKGKASDSSDGYLRELIAEILMGHPTEGPDMPWMNRGKNLEQQAADFYEFTRDVETTVVGFVTNDEETMGASPDRFVGDDGCLEIKVPAPHTHVGFLLFNEVDSKYRPQVQGQLLITGRQWVDIMSFHPEMPPAIVRVERDEAFLKVLEAELNSFVLRLLDKKRELADRGLLPADVPPPREWITDEDVEQIIAMRKAQSGAVPISV